MIGFRRGDKPVQRHRTRSRHRNDGGIGDPRFGAQHGLDLRRLDADAIDLHLAVNAAE